MTHLQNGHYSEKMCTPQLETPKMWTQKPETPKEERLPAWMVQCSPGFGLRCSQWAVQHAKNPSRKTEPSLHFHCQHPNCFSKGPLQDQLPFSEVRPHDTLRPMKHVLQRNSLRPNSFGKPSKNPPGPSTDKYVRKTRHNFVGTLMH